MTQVWQGEKVVAVTRVQTDSCIITQVKSETVDGYKAVQIGFGARKEKNIKKPQKGHVKGLGSFAKLKEFRLDLGDISGIKRGDSIDISSFAVGDNIQVTATSKGKGFQGVVRRHGFKGSKKTHGNKDQLRMSGSVGATGPAHVFKGTRMGGRMGNDQVTVKNLEVIEIDFANNIFYIKGAVPGARNGLVMISGQGEIKVKSGKSKVESGDNKESRIKNQELGDNKERIITEKTEEAKNIEAVIETPEQVEKEVVEAKERVDEKKDK